MRFVRESALSCLAIALATHVAADSASGDGQDSCPIERHFLTFETDEAASFLQHGLPRAFAQQRQADKEKPAENVNPAGISKVPSIGIINLDGYYYPTQPGDVNDLRTWCEVDPDELDNPDYQCKQPLKKGEFGAEYAVLDNFTFEKAQDATARFSDMSLLPSLTNAVRYLLQQDHIKAITCNVGFCAALEPLLRVAVNGLLVNRETIRIKPTLLGSPGLLHTFSPRTSNNAILKIDPEKEKVLLLVSAFGGAQGSNLGSILKANIFNVTPAEPEEESARKIHNQTGMLVPAHRGSIQGAIQLLENLEALNVSDMAEHLVVIGWNKQEGYIPVDYGGGFHNVNLTLESYRDLMDLAFVMAEADGFKIKAIIAESTEMPAHSNKIRMDYNVPVFDISTVGQCLMQASASYTSLHEEVSVAMPYETLFENAEFMGCLEAHFNSSLIERKFGTQKDGTLKFYEGLSKDEVEFLTCNGGRPTSHPPIGRLMKVYDVGHPLKVGHVNPVCFTTNLCQCEGVPAREKSCPLPCPGSANCGGGYYGTQLNPLVIGENFPCGPRGDLCPDTANLPPLGPACEPKGKNSNVCPSYDAKAQSFMPSGWTMRYD